MKNIKDFKEFIIDTHFNAIVQVLKSNKDIKL